MRVYEMTDNPAAREMIGYLLCRGGVHKEAYAKALEDLTGVEMTKLLPIRDTPNDEPPKKPRSIWTKGTTEPCTALARRTIPSSARSATAHRWTPARSAKLLAARPRGRLYWTCPNYQEFASGVAEEDVAEIVSRIGAS
jgi:Mn-containing catalase